MNLNSLHGVFVAGALLLLAGTTSALAGTDLLNGDGSFSTCTTAGTACSTGYFAPGSNGSTSPTGWNTTSTYSFLITPSALSGPQGNQVLNTGSFTLAFAGLSPDGGNFLLQDGDYHTGMLNQTLSNLVTGQAYAVSFYQAFGQQSGYAGSTTDQWQVSLTNSLTQVSTTQNSALVTLGVGGYSSWVMQTLIFVATAATEVLGFTASGAGQPPFAALDGVTVVAVPEPASFALLGGALMGMIGVRRGKTRRG